MRIGVQISIRCTLLLPCLRICPQQAPDTPATHYDVIRKCSVYLRIFDPSSPPLHSKQTSHTHMFCILYLLAVILFSIASTVFAAIYCIPPPPLRKEPTTDCLAIIAHIPSVPLPIPGDLFSAARRPRDSPFLPRAVFRYGECIVQISYHSTPHPAPEYGFGGFRTDIFVRQARRSAPHQSLSDASIFQIWTASKLAIQNIVAQCTISAWWGLNWEFVNVPEIPGAWYAVEVSRNTVPIGISVDSDAKKLVSDGQQVLRGVSRSNRGKGYGEPNKFRVAIFDLS